MSVTISPVKNKGGEVVGASVVARDVTKHKQAETVLRLSEERLRVALKNSPAVVFPQDFAVALRLDDSARPGLGLPEPSRPH